MEKEDRKKWYSDILKNWSIFFSIISNPLVIILGIASIVLLNYSSKQTDPTIANTFFLISSAITGLFGGILAKKWDDLTQETTISVRAKSAVRNLKLVLNRSIEIEKRVNLYIKRIDEKYQTKNNLEVLSTFFEEIVGQIIAIEEFIINSIQDWTDIRPEADLRPFIDLINEYKNKAIEIQTTLDNVIRELESSKETTAEEKQEKESLRKERDTLLSKLNELHSKSNLSALKAGVPNMSGSIISGGSTNFVNYTYTSEHVIDTSIPIHESNGVIDSQPVTTGHFQKGIDSKTPE
jgi:hypothetical protein